VAAKKLGELLVESGLISIEQLDSALKEEKQKGVRLGSVLVAKGFATEIDIAQTLAYQINIPYIDLNTAVIEPEAIKLIPEKLARKHIFIPLCIEKKNILRIAMGDPLNMEVLDDIRFSTGFQCIPMVATSTDIISAIKTQYHLSIPIEDIVGDIVKDNFIEIIRDKDTSRDTEELLKKSEAPPIIKMVNSIIVHGIENRASDIHVEPYDKMIHLRERVDGLLKEVMQLPKWVQGAIISRIKIMAKLDIAERRIPQDGRITVRVAGRELDMRISTLPTQYGEKIVMRLLDSKATALSLNDVGFTITAIEKRVKSIIERPQGIVLVTGPTGSGKTSSIYAMINHIKKPTVNVITLEDPIEYKLEGVSQVAIHEKVGLTFAYCLRSVLRQDPDVIFVGEMRDQETAEIALQASITGHLVFSSLHTTDAISTISRLKNMGIQPYAIASALNGIVAQRLVRKICEFCIEEYRPTDEELLKVGVKAKKGEKPLLYRGKGCKECGGSGYRGRAGVFEVVVVNNHMKDMISSNEPEEAIRNVAVASGMVPLYKDGIAKVQQRITTLDELQRVVFAKEHEVMNIACPKCSEIIRTEFTTCPYCGYSVAPKCPYCGKARESEWSHCPYCSIEFSEPNEKSLS
jgi:type IV pilus assembly protein PilB